MLHTHRRGERVSPQVDFLGTEAERAHHKIPPPGNCTPRTTHKNLLHKWPTLRLKTFQNRKLKRCPFHLRRSASVLSHVQLWPRELQLTRLFCSWDSPGKNTGVGCHFLLQGIFLTQGLNWTCVSYISCISRQILYHCATCLNKDLRTWGSKPRAPLEENSWLKEWEAQAMCALGWSEKQKSRQAEEEGWGGRLETGSTVEFCRANFYLREREKVSEGWDSQLQFSMTLCREYAAQGAIGSYWGHQGESWRWQDKRAEGRL